MKWVKLLIIILSLSQPIHSYACWDEDWDDDSGWYDDNDNDDDWWNEDNESDDDWWNEDNYDDDYAWDIDLPDVIITPDDDDSWDESDDDWWRTDDSDDDDSWDGGNDDWWDDDSYTDNDSHNVGNNFTNTYFSNMKCFGNYSPSENEIDINRKSFITLPASWPSQNTKMGCVSTVLEYVSNYLHGSLTYDSYVLERSSFEIQYQDLFNSDLTTDGVIIENMEHFFTECGFNVEHVYFPYEIMGYILEGNPVIASAKNDSDGSTAHEVFIIGYFRDTEHFQTVDPSNGTYETHKFEDLYLKSIFVIKK